MPTAVSKEKKSVRGKHRSRPELKLVLKNALRKKFPEDTIDISDGFEGNIHILVVSRAFDRMSHRSRYAYLWRIVESTDLTTAENDLITVVLPVSTGELK